MHRLPRYKLYVFLSAMLVMVEPYLDYVVQNSSIIPEIC